MMSPKRLFHSLLRRQNDVLVEQLAGQIAQQCRPAVWECVQQKALGMSLPMARGYIHAFATGFVVAEVELAQSHAALPSDLRERVIDTASARLVEMVVDDLLAARSTREPLAAAA